MDIAVLAYTIVFGTGILGFLLFQSLVNDASFPRKYVMSITLSYTFSIWKGKDFTNRTAWQMLRILYMWAKAQGEGNSACPRVEGLKLALQIRHATSLLLFEIIWLFVLWPMKHGYPFIFFRLSLIDYVYRGKMPRKSENMYLMFPIHFQRHFLQIP